MDIAPGSAGAEWEGILEWSGFALKKRNWNKILMHRLYHSSGRPRDANMSAAKIAAPVETFQISPQLTASTHKVRVLLSPMSQL
jgi:hypothetical protein|tara:strand:- start:3483 stop:3734 length:252 start_codon:yes stop_codon:yes gene_type:complete